ncbi:porin family protein [Dawidia soli]|uniref:Outer membrane beta-barrel protein n=1 Tax=Dawidia soli TaxID=2782352 RepID=A0AAP2D7C6_9BACT|nr:porin family protein [Dawidia soli]MBT1686604.1 outer membrane beta-barrel protein [Dawidia soli]
MSLLAATCPSIAQNSESRHSVGIAAGLNVSSLHAEKNYFADELESKIGFHLGVFYGYSFNTTWGLSTGLSYSQAGAKLKDGDRSYRLDYLALPVTLDYKLVEWATVYAGPQVGFKVKGDGPGIYGEFESVDIGALAGMEVMPASRLGIAIQYYHGFVYNTKAFYTTGPTPRDVEELKMNQNRIFQVSLRYYILR